MTVPETKECGHCQKEINVKFNICPFCGGHQDDTSEQLPPECPRCGVSLTAYESDDEEYDICPQCGGMWLDRDDFHRATATRYVYKAVEIKSEYRQTPIRGPIDYIPCVRCGKMMNRKNFGKISGVIIDRCGRHGVWLDAGELEKIQHFIADGGLDKSRDREIMKNKMEIKEVALTANENKFTQRVLHFWNFKRWMFRGW
jgi:Zn-finger nucleic acid-binding protein